MTTSPGLPYIFILLSKYIRDIRQDIFLRICKYMPHISNSWSKIYSIYRISNFRIYVSCVYDFSMGVWGQSVYQAALRRREIGRNALFSLFLFLLFASFSFLFVGSLSRFYWWREKGWYIQAHLDECCCCWFWCGCCVRGTFTVYTMLRALIYRYVYIPRHWKVSMHTQSYLLACSFGYLGFAV